MIGLVWTCKRDHFTECLGFAVWFSQPDVVHLLNIHLMKEQEVALKRRDTE